MWLITLVLAPISSLAELPAEIFDPPAPIRYIPRGWRMALLDGTALRAVQLLAIALTTLAMAGRTWRWAVVPCVIALTMHQSIIRGLGHVNHTEIPLLLATYVFAIRAVTPRPSRNFEPLAIAWILLLTYMITGTYRVAHGGLSVFTSDSIAYWSVENSLREAYFQFGQGKLVVSHPLVIALFKIGFVVTTVFEITAPWAIVSARYRRIFVPMLIAFHVGVLVFMNILFWENLGLLILLFLFPRQAKSEPLAETVPPERQSAAACRAERIDRARRKWSNIALGIMACCAAGLAMTGGRPIAVEAALWTVILWPVLRNCKLRAFMQSLPRPTLAAICMLTVLILAGHAYYKPQRTFPFVPWWMYGVPAESDLIAVYRVRATTVAGQTVAVNPELLYPTYGLGRARFFTKIRHLASRMDRREREHSQLVALLRTFATAYSARYGVKLRSIAVVRSEVPYLTPHQSTEATVLNVALDVD